MKLPATVLAALCLAGGCETAVDFAHRSGPAPAPAATEKGAVERVQVELPRQFAKPPQAAPIAKPTPAPIAKKQPAPKKQPVVQANACGPCGMG